MTTRRTPILPPPFAQRTATMVRHAFDARDAVADGDVEAARRSLGKLITEAERAIRATHHAVPRELADTVRPKDHARRFTDAELAESEP